MPIVPDSKDWTWVLDRPCPECRFVASAHPQEQVGVMIRTNASDWFSVLAEAPTLLRGRCSEGRWSPLEYACHVRDVFGLYDQRLQLMLETDDPTYPNWDQDESAIADCYNEQDPAVVAQELTAAADAIAARFDAVNGATWDRRGFRSDGARFTVSSFSRYLIHDPVHHLYDVSVDLPKLRAL